MISAEYCPDDSLSVAQARQDHGGTRTAQFIGCALPGGDSNYSCAAVEGCLDIAGCIADKNRGAAWEFRLVLFRGPAACHRHEVRAYVVVGAVGTHVEVKLSIQAERL
jgi:hypothetical protein